MGFSFTIEQKKEDSFSSVKPTRIFSPLKFVFETKNDSRYQFYCLLFLQKVLVSIPNSQALKSFIYTIIVLKKNIFFNDKSH